MNTQHYIFTEENMKPDNTNYQEVQEAKLRQCLQKLKIDINNIVIDGQPLNAVIKNLSLDKLTKLTSALESTESREDAVIKVVTEVLAQESSYRPS